MARTKQGTHPSGTKDSLRREQKRTRRYVRAAVNGRLQCECSALVKVEGKVAAVDEDGEVTKISVRLFCDSCGKEFGDFDPELAV